MGRQRGRPKKVKRASFAWTGQKKKLSSSIKRKQSSREVEKLKSFYWEKKEPTYEETRKQDAIEQTDLSQINESMFNKGYCPKNPIHAMDQAECLQIKIQEATFQSYLRNRKIQQGNLQLQSKMIEQSKRTPDNLLSKVPTVYHIPETKTYYNNYIPATSTKFGENKKQQTKYLATEPSNLELPELYPDWPLDLQVAFMMSEPPNPLGHRPEIKEQLLRSYDLHVSAAMFEDMLLEERLQKCHIASESVKKVIIGYRKEYKAIIEFPDNKLSSWEQGIRLLVQYRIKHGDCKVTTVGKHSEMGSKSRQLTIFVRQQRMRYHKYLQRYTEHQREKDNENYSLPMKQKAIMEQLEDDIGFLNRVDFIWCAAEPPRSWDECFEDLKLFEKEHGHTRVPQLYPLNQRMANWVNSQRKTYELLKSGKMSPMTAERIEKLEQIGFVWKQRFGRPKKGDECYRNKKHGPLEKGEELEGAVFDVADSAPTEKEPKEVTIQETVNLVTCVKKIDTAEKNVDKADTKPQPFENTAIAKQNAFFTSSSVHTRQAHEQESTRQTTSQGVCQEVFITNPTKEKIPQQESITSSSLDLFLRATV